MSDDMSLENRIGRLEMSLSVCLVVVVVAIWYLHKDTAAMISALHDDTSAKFAALQSDTDAKFSLLEKMMEAGFKKLGASLDREEAS